MEIKPAPVPIYIDADVLICGSVLILGFSSARIR